MTEKQTANFDNLAPRVDRGDIYRYVKSTEHDDITHAMLARRVHAKSYRGEGFIHDDAIDKSGQVAADIDKARGDSVEYYLGYSDQGEAVSTLRKVSIPEELSFDSLPGYQLCKDTLSNDGFRMLLDAECEERPIKEISSFGHIPEVSATAGLELLRNVLQESHGTGEVWFFTMVEEKYQTLVNLFGPRAVRKIGEPIALKDDRVGDVSLVPALVDTTSFFEDIKDGVIDEPKPHRRHRLVNSLRNFTTGIDKKGLSEEVLYLIDEDLAFDFTTYVQDKGVEKKAIEWSQPVKFDLASHADVLRSKRLIDEGAVQNVIDPSWHEELPTESALQITERDGSWFYYPWGKSLVHFPDRDTYRDIRQKRDRHLVTKEEQSQLHKKTALYGGLSVGSHVLEHMVYSGVGGAHILADFDTISTPNLNRIHLGMPEVDELKVDALAKRVSELDPYLELTLLRDGITEASLESLKKAPDIIFDEVDDFAAKALLRVYARKHQLPLVMATDVGYKSIIDVERYDTEDARPFNGRINERTFDALLAGSLTSEQRMKLTTKIIGLSNASFRLLKSISDPALEGIPQLGVTAGQGGALATIVARDILLDRNVPSGRSVHDARKALGLPSDVPAGERFKIIKDFLAKR